MNETVLEQDQPRVIVVVMGDGDDEGAGMLGGLWENAQRLAAARKLPGPAEKLPAPAPLPARVRHAFD